MRRERGVCFKDNSHLTHKSPRFGQDLLLTMPVKNLTYVKQLDGEQSKL